MKNLFQMIELLEKKICQTELTKFYGNELLFDLFCPTNQSNLNGNEMSRRNISVKIFSNIIHIFYKSKIS